MFLWLKFTTVTPSFYFKNRLFIEKGFRRNNMYTFFGNTQKSFTWLKSSSSNLTLYWFRRRYFKWLRALLLTLLVFYFCTDFNLMSASTNWAYASHLYYLLWRFFDGFLFFVLQLQHFLLLITTAATSLVLNAFLPKTILSVIRKETRVPQAPQYAPEFKNKKAAVSYFKKAFELKYSTSSELNSTSQIFKNLFNLNYSLPGTTNSRIVDLEPLTWSTASWVFSTPSTSVNTVLKGNASRNFYLDKVVGTLDSRQFLLNPALPNYSSFNYQNSIKAVKTNSGELIRTARWLTLSLNSPRASQQSINFSTPTTQLNRTTLLTLPSSVEWLNFREYLYNTVVETTRTPQNLKLSNAENSKLLTSPTRYPNLHYAFVSTKPEFTPLNTQTPKLLNGKDYTKLLQLTAVPTKYVTNSKTPTVGYKLRRAL